MHAAVLNTRRIMLLLAAIAIALAAWMAPTAAEEHDGEPDHVVAAGAVPPDDPLKLYGYLDYYPRHLQVHRGDRVRWEFPTIDPTVVDLVVAEQRQAQHIDLAFHTVTFADDPDGFDVVRLDELPGTLAFDERVFFTSGCGRPDQPVCTIADPGTFVSSGTHLEHQADGGIEPFDAVIDLAPGTYTYFCTIHHPAMQGSIEVVDDGVPLENPAPDELAAAIAERTAVADALVAERSVPKPVDEAGGRTWSVEVGARTSEDGGVHVHSFLPAALEIRAGDAVRFTTQEVHGVTFPGDHGYPMFFGLNCEPDGPDEGLVGVPMIGLLAVFADGCPADWQFELTLTPLGAEPVRAPGDAVVSPTTFHSSGKMVPDDFPERFRGRPPGSGEHWPSEFEAAFPVPGTYGYRCYIHPEYMTGSITVR